MKHIKVLTFFVLALALLLTLCACNENDGTTKATETTTGEGTPTTPPEENNPDSPNEPNEPNTSTDVCAHQYGEWLLTLQPTCVQKGLQTRACTLCGKSETGYLDVLGHDEIEHDAKAPTCTEGGWKAYVTCSRCDYSTYADIAATHNEANQDFNCPQCVEKWGQLEFVCEDWEYTVSGIGTFHGTTLNIPSVYQGKPVSYISNFAFENCTFLTSVTIPDSVISIGNGAFSGCTGLTSIILPFVGDSAKDANDRYQYPFGYIFGSSSYTGSIATPQSYYYGRYDGILWVESSTYYIPASLKSVTITGGNILRGAFDNCSNLTSITIGDGVTSIGEDAFSGCTWLTSVEFAENSKLTSIGNYAFSGCMWLTSITIPDSVTSIGNYAFGYCEGLMSITIPDSVTSIGSSAFSGCTGLTSITIPDSVTSIGNYAFSGCTGLTSITIPDSVMSIGDGAFSNCAGLTSIIVDETNPNWHIAGNCLIGTNSKTLIWGCQNSIIPTDGSVTSIGDSAFSKCTGLTSVMIPDSVTSIGNYAFDYCEGLTSITIPDSVASIGDYAFCGCTGLTSVTIPDSVTSIGNYAFDYCKGLTSITIPDSVTSIGVSAFSRCTGLTSIIVDENNLIYHSAGNCLIETASKTLIAGCQKSIIPTDGSVASIGIRAFYYCPGLTSIMIPDSVTSMGYAAFLGCGGLTGIVIPDSMTSIGQSVFRHCEGLTSITISDSVTIIDYSAFEGCTGLTSVYYTGTAEEWDQIMIYDGNDSITTATIYYYSPDGAPDATGNYWHYDENGNPVAW